jgi:hypothetical protein
VLLSHARHGIRSPRQHPTPPRGVSTVLEHGRHGLQAVSLSGRSPAHTHGCTRCSKSSATCSCRGRVGFTARPGCPPPASPSPLPCTHCAGPPPCYPTHPQPSKLDT